MPAFRSGGPALCALAPVPPVRNQGRNAGGCAVTQIFDAAGATGTRRRRVAIVTGDAATREDLARGLAAAGFAALGFASAGAAARSLDRATVEALVLDIGRAGPPGLTLLRALRSAGRDCRVICLSDRDDPGERIAGLEAGADDFLVKPVSTAEVQARIGAILRRAAGITGSRLALGDLVLDLRRHVALRGGIDLGLSPRELHLLTLLMERPGEVIDRDRLLADLWGDTAPGRANALDVAIGRLRGKLGPGVPALRTLRGRGYLLG